jgi:hypothetical protein
MKATLPREQHERRIATVLDLGEVADRTAEPGHGAAEAFV